MNTLRVSPCIKNFFISLRSLLTHLLSKSPFDRDFSTLCFSRRKIFHDSNASRSFFCNAKQDNKGKNRYHSILKLLKKRNDHSHSSRIVTIEIVLSLEFNPSSIVKRFLPFVSTSTRFIYPSKQVAHCY